jgi:hypothetical protein
MKNLTKNHSLIKWMGTSVLIIGTIVNALGYYPYGPLLLVMGSAFWLTAAIKMQDKPLIVTNLIMGMSGLIGVSLNYSGFIG